MLLLILLTPNLYGSYKYVISTSHKLGGKASSVDCREKIIIDIWHGLIILKRYIYTPLIFKHIHNEQEKKYKRPTFRAIWNLLF